MADFNKRGLLASLIEREKNGEFSSENERDSSPKAENLSVKISNPAVAPVVQDSNSPEDETYLIFSIKGFRYVIKSSEIQQIVRAQKVRSLPFVPKYIEGILNVHGNPYTVVNTLLLDGEDDCEIEGLTFIVLKRDDDQFGIHVSNIELFFEPEDDDIFEDKVKYKRQFIPIFDSDRIEASLLRDLAEESV